MEPLEKAVIMARGLGTRMRKPDESAVLDKDQMEAAETGVKAMIPIGRPFLDYVLSGLADAGFSRVCVVVGPEHRILRHHYIAEEPPKRIRIDFAIQREPLGTADAVLSAKGFVSRDFFLVINSDNYYPVEALRALREQGEAAVALFDRVHLVAESNIPEDRVLKFALAKVGKDNYLESVLEKPSEEAVRAMGSPLYVSMNCWVFSPAIFRACQSIKPSARGELELTDAVQYAIDQLNERFKVLTFKSPVLDMSGRSDIAAIADKLRGVNPNP
jgi:glucose-1-phosphate thymidylyltransferase